MKLDGAADTVDAVMHISERLMRCGLEQCNFDKDWKKLIRKQLGQVDKVTLLTNLQVNVLILYHCLLWKTGDGWTYARSVKELKVANPYHPKILVALKDRMCSTTQLKAESLEDFNLETLDADFASLLGSVEDWKVIGILQFFAESEGPEECLMGPTSQETKVVNVKSGNDWSWKIASERSDASNEPRWPGKIVTEDFTRTNNLRKLYEIRPPELENMSFAQFNCMYRHIRQTHPEYKKYERLIESWGDNVGPRCEKTLIAGTLDLCPKYMRLENDQIVKLREEQNVIIRLNTHNQALSDKAKNYLFGCWRRPDHALLEEVVNNTNIKKWVRLLLYPASAHLSE